MRQLSKSVVLFLAFAIALGAPINAFAQEDGATPQMTDSERFSQLVSEGTNAFKSKDFQKAAHDFEKAFEISPVEQLLKNAMVAWYNAANCTEAVRVAARLVAFVGKKDVTQEGAKDIRKVVKCALEKADAFISNNQFDQAKSLLTTSSAAYPSEEQRDLIDSFWKKITLKGDDSSPSPTENAANEEDYSHRKTFHFYNVAPWLSAGLFVAGAGLIGSGAYMFAKDSPNVTAGRALTGTGALSLYASTAIFIYWLVTNAPSDDPQEAFQFYNNTNYKQQGGISTINFSPAISPQQVGGSFRIRF